MAEPYLRLRANEGRLDTGQHVIKLRRLTSLEVSELLANVVPARGGASGITRVRRQEDKKGKDDWRVRGGELQA
eukprot:scaffold287980_cov31-Tisochrysis_lutea.AAC.3